METIKKLRERAGLTQSEVASKLNVTQECVSMWETGESLPRADKLPKLAEILGCKIEDLFEQKENTAPAV